MTTNPLTRIRAAIAWARAQNLSSRGHYDRALALVRSFEPPPRMSWAWHLFMIHQLSLMGRSVDTLTAAVSLIDELMERPTLTANGRYFLTFAQWCGSTAFRHLFPATELPEKLEIELEAVRLSEVSRGWKRKFPMPIHPEWKG